MHVPVDTHNLLLNEADASVLAPFGTLNGAFVYDQGRIRGKGI